MRNIALRRDKSGEEEDGKSVSTLTVCPNAAKEGNLTVVEKSSTNLLNWAEEHFPGSKIVTTNETLCRGSCHAIGINDDWAIVVPEAIKRPYCHE
jgi:hypothetical protein